MKTSELVKAVAMETGLTVSATEKAVNAVFSAIKKEVGAGGEVKIFKFGTFSVAELGEREGLSSVAGAETGASGLFLAGKRARIEKHHRAGGNSVRAGRVVAFSFRPGEHGAIFLQSGGGRRHPCGHADTGTVGRTVPA